VCVWQGVPAQNFIGDESDIGLITEALIESIATLRPKALHCVVIQNCPRCRADGQWSAPLAPRAGAARVGLTLPGWTAVKMVAAARRVPVVDLRLPCLLAQNCSWYPPAAAAHCGARTHHEVAQQVAWLFSYAMEHASGRTHAVFPQQALRPLMACLGPLSTFDAANTSTEQPTLTDGWSHTDEGRGKPGWVASRVGAKIHFDLRFGNHPSLNLAYLKSYEGMGSAQLTLNSRDLTVDASWPNRVSMTQVMWAQVGANPLAAEDDGGMKGFSVRPHSHARLTVTFLGRRADAVDVGSSRTKFKIISVQSC